MFFSFYFRPALLFVSEFLKILVMSEFLTIYNHYAKIRQLNFLNFTSTNYKSQKGRFPHPSNYFFSSCFSCSFLLSIIASIIALNCSFVIVIVYLSFLVLLLFQHRPRCAIMDSRDGLSFILAIDFFVAVQCSCRRAISVIATSIKNRLASAFIHLADTIIMVVIENVFFRLLHRVIAIGSFFLAIPYCLH